MKILIVRTFPSIIDPNKYNVQEIGLAKALTRAGHECGIVLYYGKNKDSIETIPVLCGEEEYQITVYRLHGFGILKNGFFPSLHKITKEYDVIQVHEYDQITSWLYYAWSKRPVIIYHGPYYHPYNKRYNLKCKIFDQTFLRIKKNENVLCFTKSHAAADFLGEKGFKNVIAVGVGLDTENFISSAMIEKEIEIRSDKFNLLYVGKIEPRRNSLFLVEVLEKVIENNSNIHCVIVGNGEEDYKKKFLEKAACLIQNGRLVYYESASQRQLASLYRQVQLMLFPSNYEIFGMVLLEAVYFGLPIISSKNGGADMLIEDGKNGVIVSSFDVQEWKNRIEELYQNPKEYSQLKSNLDKYDRNRLSWKYICDNYYNKIYKEIV